MRLTYNNEVVLFVSALIGAEGFNRSSSFVSAFDGVGSFF